LIVASATSAGGLTALAVKLSQKKNPVHEVTPNSSESSTIGQDRRRPWQESQANSRRQSFERKMIEKGEQS